MTAHSLGWAIDPGANVVACGLALAGIVLKERHLMRVLASYFSYYHLSRAHLSLDRNAPVPRDIKPPKRGRISAIPQVGGATPSLPALRVGPGHCFSF
jgi:hypothetical protein